MANLTPTAPTTVAKRQTCRTGGFARLLGRPQRERDRWMLFTYDDSLITSRFIRPVMEV